MIKLVSGSLMGKLIALFLAVSLIPIAVVGYLSFTSAKEALLKTEFAKLETARNDRTKSLRAYVRAVMSDLKYLGLIKRLNEAFKLVVAAEKSAASSPDSADQAYSDARAPINGLCGELFADFEAIRKQDALQDIYLISTSGQVVYTQKGEFELGRNLKAGELGDSGLARLWAAVVKTGKPASVDMSVYKTTGRPAMFFGIPVRGQDGKLMGVLAGRIGTEGIDRAISEASSMGRTGNAFVVGNDMSLRSNSRVEKNATVLSRKIDTIATREALADKAGVSRIRDHRGVPVVSAYSHVGLNEDEGLGADFEWAVVETQDEDEVFEPINVLGFRILLVQFLVGAIVAVLAFAISRSLTRPLTAVVERVDKISNGDLTVDVEMLNRSDEIGTLTRAMSAMVTNLRDQLGKVIEGINVLTSAASEISVTVSQVAAGTSQTSSAVIETTHTIEEIRQTAAVSRENAKNVSQEAQRAVEVSASGHKATQETIERMKVIKEQMETIGETVVRLSDHSQAIEEIIGTVKDLADQSNLLAVNASIEAARAGDQGKGFAVVAQEIKSLADQSKEATDQVRSILEKTRKWVSAVVMATEQGGKAVAAGVEQSTVAGASIQVLASGVTSSSQAAAVIEASSRQQSVGMEQVATAMESIDQAVKQNIEGTSQLDAAARNLAALAGDLQGMVGMYKLREAG